MSLETGKPSPGDRLEKTVPESDSSPAELKARPKFLESAQRLEGLFSLYRADSEKIYLELKNTQLDTPYLWTMTLNSGLGSHDILSGTPLGNFVVEFRPQSGAVQVVKKNPYFTAAPESPGARAVKKDFADSVLATLKVVGKGPDSLLLDATPLFVSDLPDLSLLLTETLETRYVFDKKGSNVQAAKAFPLNLEIDSQLHYIPKDLTPANPFLLDSLNAAVPDARSLPLKVHHSLSALPQGDYVPRMADDRVGYFETAVKDFSISNPSSTVRYIERWNLDQKPIVFWIENTTPVEYRKAIEEAVLEWNKAFEKIGIKNALEVKVQPDHAGWEAGDIRYNMIRWINSSETSFAGLGPAHVNPMTGEIYNAQVVIDGEAIRMIQGHYANFDLLQDRAPTGKDGARMVKVFDPRSKACRYPDMAARDASSSALALALEGRSGDPARERPQTPLSFIQAYVKDVVMHEIGHVLGLRHNFHGHTSLSLKDLQNPEVTHKTGLSSSIMDYTPVNILAFGKEGADYFSPTIGPYDYWAIEYGYSPTGAKDPGEERPALEKIASQASKKEYAYATDEDTYSPFSVDPTINIFDLSSNPLAFSTRRLEFYRGLWKKMDQRLPFKNEGYEEVRKAFAGTLTRYLDSLETPLRHIGGIYFHRAHPGDPEARPPFVPVEKSKQLRALELLDRYLFSPSAFNFSSRFLNKLAPDRSSNNFTPLGSYFKPLEFPLLQKITRAQDRALDTLFDPILLNRMLENEHRVTQRSHALTLAELFQWMTDTFWQELDAGEAVQDTRRALQRSHLDHLVELVEDPSPVYLVYQESRNSLGYQVLAEVPADARSLARYQLENLHKKVKSCLKNRGEGLDLETRTHLRSCLSTLNEVLDIPLHRR